MSINLDQTGPSHLLSTDEDGLILNGSQVISKSIHVAATPPQNLKLLWLDTTQAGYAAFPLGGGTDYILRTDGLGNVSWVPPSSLDVTRYRYTASTLTTTTGIDNGSTRSVIRFNNTSMKDADTIYISNYDLANNDISEFLESLNLFGNFVRRGYIKVEKQNNPNWFLIFQYKVVTVDDNYTEITVSIARSQGNFTNNDPVYVTFSSSGPEGVPQDLTIFATITTEQTLTNKTLTSPLVSGLSLLDGNIVFEGSTPDGYETTLSVVDPTADRTVLIPDASTTLVGTDVAQTLSNKTLTSPYIDDPVVRNSMTVENDIYVVSDNMNLLELEGSDPNVVLNQTAAGNNTINFQSNGVEKFALGRNSSDNFYITRQPDGTWIDDTLVINIDSGSVSIGSTEVSSDKLTGALIVAGGAGFGGNIHANGLENTPIGAVIRNTGSFTTIRANGDVTLTSTTQSNDSASGALVLSGGVGIAKNLYIDGIIYAGAKDVNETTLTGYNLVAQGPNAKIRIGPNYTAGGDRDYIDIISQNSLSTIVTENDNFLIKNLKDSALITLDAPNGTVAIASIKSSSSNTTGALTVVGGVGVQGNIYANDMYSDNSQVVTLAASQTILNKTLTSPTASDLTLTGALTVGGTTGIIGQYLQTTGTGIQWVNPSAAPTVVFAKDGDQTTTSGGAVVRFSSTPFLQVGASFGSMANTGIFTFSVVGYYQVIIHYNLGAAGGGDAMPTSDFWGRLNGSDSPTRYLQLNSTAVRRGSVTDVFNIANIGDTVSWFANNAIAILGTGATASKITILRLG
jgi:hypothetical protein